MFLHASFVLLITLILIIAFLFIVKVLFFEAKKIETIKDIGKIFKNKISAQNEVKMEEVLFLDNKRRVVLIKYKNNKYLLLIGSEQDIVIEKFQE